MPFGSEGKKAVTSLQITLKALVTGLRGSVHHQRCYINSLSTGHHLLAHLMKTQMSTILSVPIAH